MWRGGKNVFDSCQTANGTITSFVQKGEETQREADYYHPTAKLKIKRALFC